MLVPITAWAQAWNKALFESTTLEDVYQQLALKGTPDLQKNIRIIAPDKAENGAVVQVDIQVAETAPTQTVQEITLIAEGNPTPLVARFYLTEVMSPRVITRIKMAQTASLQALVKNAQGLYQQRKPVIVLEDGCASSERDEPFESSMKMRARKLEEGIEIKVIIVHPMRTGRSKNDDGQKLPAHFMQTLQLTHNGKPIFAMDASTAISKNPYLTVYLKQGQVGDVIAASWQDNLGYSGQGNTQIAI